MADAERKAEYGCWRGHDWRWGADERPDAELPPDLVTVTGTIRSLGVTGFALGGGYGRLNSRFGLGIDCIRRAEVVLANGEIVTASASADAELLWALRGGGSQFGVVTSLRLAVSSTGHLV